MTSPVYRQIAEKAFHRRFIMARKGSLSRKTYFPIVGDTFTGGNRQLECVRANKFNAARYGLLVDAAGVFTAIHSEDSSWLDGVETIVRKGKVYTFNHATSTWQEG
jgi:alkyl hydroperoxide reductase subunit AhpC